VNHDGGYVDDGDIDDGDVGADLQVGPQEKTFSGRPFKPSLESFTNDVA
jgi:hypothetical protein